MTQQEFQNLKYVYIAGLKHICRNISDTCGCYKTLASARCGRRYALSIFPTEYEETTEDAIRVSLKWALSNAAQKGAAYLVLRNGRLLELSRISMQDYQPGDICRSEDEE